MGGIRNVSVRPGWQTTENSGFLHLIVDSMEVNFNLSVGDEGR